MKIIGINFENDCKLYYFDSNNLNIEKGMHVIVETEKGNRYAIAVTRLKESNEENLEKVLRIANKDDEIKNKKNVEDSLKAMEKATKIASSLDLPMNFVNCYYTFERNQLMFFYISENRIDFRELAKELAKIYKTRIELRQIGVRDKAKEISGIGTCGRKICCSSFLDDLDSVSISMAKNQNLALNPNKINGLCGRLLCCLTYEDKLYSSNRQGLPNVGDIVNTEHGEGTVILLDILNRKYIVNVNDYGKLEVKLPNKCDECGKCNK